MESGSQHRSRPFQADIFPSPWLINMYSHTLSPPLPSSSQLDLGLGVRLPLAETPSLINILNFYSWRRARRLPLRRGLLDPDANGTLIRGDVSVMAGH